MKLTCPIYQKLADMYLSAGLSEDVVSNYIRKVGYFLSEFNYETDMPLAVSLPTMPLPNKWNDCVVIMTGCFNPIHTGHISAINAAVKYLSKVFGYINPLVVFNPDSDEYCATKGEYYPYHERIAKINSATKDFGYVTDNWQQFFPAVNFTTVYERTKAYLARYDIDLPVYLVFGSDNDNFSQLYPDNTIIVPRGSDKAYSKHVTGGGFLGNSTALRADGIKRAQPKELILRVTEDFPLHILDKYFKKVYINNEVRQLDSKYISIDSCTRGRHNLEISRLFKLGGNTQIGYCPRPGSKSFEDQLGNIPKSSYYLFDDDSFTGKTLQFASNLLREYGIGVLGTSTIVTSNQQYEVLDTRDFLLEDNAGLVVKSIELINCVNAVPFEELVNVFEEYTNQIVPQEAIVFWKYLGLNNRDFLTTDFLHNYGLKSLIEVENGRC